MKIAFCFLTYKNLSQPKLWFHFINNNRNRMNAYIHSKEEFYDHEYHLHNYCLTEYKVGTHYGHKSLVQASLRLFEEALKDESNTFFILLSDKCVPIYSFDYIYNKIFQINNNIIHTSVTGEPNMWRFNHLNDKNFFDKGTFLNDSQWVLLNRPTAKWFVDYNFLYLYSDNFFAVDEHYFGNLCRKFNIGFHNGCVVYRNWSDRSDEDGERPYPKTYLHLTNEMVEEIRLTTSALFMRKISSNCKLPGAFYHIK